MNQDIPALYATADSAGTMSAFLAAFAEYYRDSEAAALVDLYVDEELPAGNASRVLKELQTRARDSFVDHRSSKLLKRIFRRDPLMGYKVNFSNPDQRAEFSTIAHLVINSEVWIGDSQILGTVESENLIWIQIPGRDLAEIMGSDLVAGRALEFTPC